MDNKFKTKTMLKGNIAASLLKVLWKTLYSVKYYDKSNMKVFTLSLLEHFRWGFIYFDKLHDNSVLPLLP